MSYTIKASVVTTVRGNRKYDTIPLPLPADLDAPTPTEVKALIAALSEADSLQAWCTAEADVAEAMATLQVLKTVGGFEGNPRPGTRVPDKDWPVFLSRTPSGVEGNALLRAVQVAAGLA